MAAKINITTLLSEVAILASLAGIFCLTVYEIVAVGDPKQSFNSKPSIAKLERFSNTVKLKKRNEIAWSSVNYQDAPLYREDRVYTGEDSSAQIGFPGHTINLGPESLIIVSKTNNLDHEIRIIRGDIRVETFEPRKASPGKVMPKLALAVKGTKIKLAPKPTKIQVSAKQSGTRLDVERGQVQFEQRGQKARTVNDHRRVQIKEGKAVIKKMSLFLSPTLPVIPDNKSVDLRWVGRNISSYQVEVSKQASMANPVVKRSTKLSGTSVKLPMGRYYWRVIGFMGGERHRSEVRSFQVQQSGPPKFISPSGFAMNIPSGMVDRIIPFSWLGRGYKSFRLKIFRDGQLFIDERTNGTSAYYSLPEGQYRYQLLVPGTSQKSEMRSLAIHRVKEKQKPRKQVLAAKKVPKPVKAEVPTGEADEPVAGSLVEDKANPNNNNKIGSIPQSDPPAKPMLAVEVFDAEDDVPEQPVAAIAPDIQVVIHDPLAPTGPNANDSILGQVAEPPKDDQPAKPKEKKKTESPKVASVKPVLIKPVPKKEPEAVVVKEKPKTIEQNKKDPSTPVDGPEDESKQYAHIPPTPSPVTKTSTEPEKYYDSFSLWGFYSPAIIYYITEDLQTGDTSEYHIIAPRSFGLTGVLHWTDHIFTNLDLQYLYVNTTVENQVTTREVEIYKNSIVLGSGIQFDLLDQQWRVSLNYSRDSYDLLNSATLTKSRIESDSLKLKGELLVPVLPKVEANMAVWKDFVLNVLGSEHGTETSSWGASVGVSKETAMMGYQANFGAFYQIDRKTQTTTVNGSPSEVTISTHYIGIQGGL